MSISAILRALGWIPVVWLLGVHLLVERGRLPRDGAAFRLAGCAAAGLVITAGVMFAMWPVAALGLLWLRTEVFAHRHSLELDEARRERFRREGPQPRLVRPAAGQVGTISQRIESATRRRPRFGPRAVNAVFKIEVMIAAIIALVAFSAWAQHQKASFDQNANTTLCRLRGGC